MAKKLLLIEDSLSIQALVASTFEHADVDLIVTDNAADGLHKAQTMSPDIVLADASMPEMDGFQLCQRIRQTPHGRQIPVVLLTSGFAVYDIAKGTLVGVTTHLVKPFASHTLIELVQQCLPLGQRPTPALPVSTPLSPGPAFVLTQTTEPGRNTAPGSQAATHHAGEQEPGGEATEPLEIDLPSPDVLQDSIAAATAAHTALPTSAGSSQDSPAHPHALSPLTGSSTATDSTTSALYQALGARVEQMLRETLETHLHSALEQLLPQLLAAAHTVIAEKMPAMLAALLQQEIDQLKRAVEEESRHD